MVPKEVISGASNFFTKPSIRNGIKIIFVLILVKAAVGSDELVRSSTDSESLKPL